MDPEERAARERLAALFRAFDRLTPDELARIGYRPAPDEERQPLLDALDAAARRTGRTALVDEARTAAIRAVMTRYAAGTYRPTFLGLNWGISQGTVEGRVAIAEAIADAAAAAVVEDALDPEVASALAGDAAAITDLARGEASDGSLAQVLRDSEDPELGHTRTGRLVLRLAAVTWILLNAWAGAIGAFVVIALGAVAAVRSLARRVRPV